jgi:hypothetical protein
MLAVLAARLVAGFNGVTPTLPVHLGSEENRTRATNTSAGHHALRPGAQPATTCHCFTFNAGEVPKRTSDGALDEPDTCVQGSRAKRRAITDWTYLRPLRRKIAVTKI